MVVPKHGVMTISQTFHTSVDRYPSYIHGQALIVRVWRAAMHKYDSHKIETSSGCAASAHVCSFVTTINIAGSGLGSASVSGLVRVVTSQSPDSQRHVTSQGGSMVVGDLPLHRDLPVLSCHLHGTDLPIETSMQLYIL